MRPLHSNIITALTIGAITCAARAQPVNDTCADALPASIGAVNGTTLGAVTDGTTSCGNSASAPDVYYRFVAPATCTYEVVTCDGITDYDTSLSVHTSCPASAANSVACNDDGLQACDPFRSRATFSATRNAQYLIRVSGHAQSAGNFTLVIRQLGRPANDTCAGAVAIAGTGGTVDGDTTCAMSEGSMNCLIGTTGSPNQFYRWTAPSDGIVTFNTCFAETSFDTYLSASTACPQTDLNLLACNDDWCGRRSSITFGVVSGASYVVRVAGFAGDRGAFRLGWLFNETGRPNDTCGGAQPFTLGTNINGTTVAATANAHVGCFPFDTPDVYYRFYTPVETFVTLDTCVSSFDTLLSVHSGCPAGDTNVIACNDDACGRGSIVTFLAKPGTEYIVRVAGFRSTDVGTFMLRTTAEVNAVVFDPSTLGEYYLLPEGLNMSQFRARAQSLGAHMACIGSFSENQFVSKAVMQAQNVVRSVAIGLNDEATEGVLRWDDGEPVDFTFMGNGQPDNTNNAEDNFHIYDPVAGLWNDYPNGNYPGLFGVAESDRQPLAQAINSANGHLYILFKATSWEGAQARARAMGGSLVTISGPAENEFVRATFGHVGGVARGLWIGLSDAATEGTFVWAEGTSSFTNFGSGEPNNLGGNEDYVELDPDTGHWNDVPNVQLNAPKYGVAEFVLPQVIAGPVRGPGGCGSYALLSASNFYPAVFTADRLGGHIVSINSAAENEFIRATFAATGGGRRLWIGATDRDDDGNFVWLSGDPFTYTNFLDGEPNNLGGNEDYLEMFDPATGVWNDMSTLDTSAPLHFAVVELDAGCPCDWNISGSVNSQDLFDFLNDFFSGTANFNCDGVVNSQDFFDFLTCFFNACE